MNRYLLLLVFGAMYLAQAFDLKWSFGAGLSTKNLLLYVYMIVFVLGLAVRRSLDRSVPLARVHFLFGLLMLYALVSVIYVSFGLHRTGYRFLPNFVNWKSFLVDQYLFLFVFAHGLLVMRDARWLADRMLWLVLSLEVLVVVDFFNIPNLGIFTEHGGTRIEGAMGEANMYGSFLAFFLPVTVAAAVRSDGWREWFYRIFILVTLFVLILTGSRGALVGLVAGALVCLFSFRELLPEGAGPKLVLVGVATVLIAGGSAYFLSPETVESRIERSSADSIDQASAGRTRAWGELLRGMNRNPVSYLSGYGWWAYKLGGSVKFKDPHNIYLMLLYDLGVIGLMLWVAVLVSITTLAIRAAFACEDYRRPLLIGFVGGFVAFHTAAFFVVPYAPLTLIWAYAGLMCFVAWNTLYPRQRSVLRDRPVLGAERFESTENRPKPASSTRSSAW